MRFRSRYQLVIWSQLKLWLGPKDFASKIAHTQSYWDKASPPYSLFDGSLRSSPYGTLVFSHGLANGFPQSKLSKKNRKQEGSHNAIMYDLILKVTVLSTSTSIRSKSLTTAYIQGEGKRLHSLRRGV